MLKSNSKTALEATRTWSRGFTRPRSGCTARGLPTGLVTAPFVLASSIWLLEGPPLNDLIAIVKRRGSAGQIAVRGQVLMPPPQSFLQALTFNEPHGELIRARLVVGKDSQRTDPFVPMNTAHSAALGSSPSRPITILISGRRDNAAIVGLRVPPGQFGTGGGAGRDPNPR